MNFDDFKDKLIEQLQSTLAKIQESTAFIQLKEKYENLPSRAQRGVLGTIGALAFLILFAIPWFFYSSSQEAVAELEDSRQLVRDLYRVSRASRTLSLAPEGLEPTALQGRLQSVLSMARVQTEQIKSLTEFDNKGPQASKSIPKAVTQRGVLVTLSKLNLKQIVDLGQQFHDVHPSTKLVGLEVKVSEGESNYFDAVFKVVSFSLPADGSDSAPSADKQRGNKRVGG